MSGYHISTHGSRDKLGLHKLMVQANPCTTPCFDTLDTPGAQLGSSFVDPTTGLVRAMVDITLHNGVPYVIWVDNTGPSVLGPFVSYWDGSVWVDTALPSPCADNPFGVSITSDGTSVFVAFASIYENCQQVTGSGTCCLCAIECVPRPGIPCNQNHNDQRIYAWRHAIPEVWKYDGSWNQEFIYFPLENTVENCGSGDFYCGADTCVADTHPEWGTTHYNYCGELHTVSNVDMTFDNVGGGQSCDDLIATLLVAPPAADFAAKILLAAKGGSHCIAWWEHFATIDSYSTAPGGCEGGTGPLNPDTCIWQDFSTVTPIGDNSFIGSGIDGVRTDFGFVNNLSTGDAEQGMKDLVWDDGTDVPLLLFNPASTDTDFETAKVVDATDGTVLQTQANRYGERLSVFFPGVPSSDGDVRYISAQRATPAGQSYLYQMPADASGPFGDLDGYGVATLATCFGNPMPEVNNIWVDGTTNWCWYERVCDLPDWHLTVADPVGEDTWMWVNYRTVFDGTFFYTAWVDTPFGGGLGDQRIRVWRKPVCRCCDCCLCGPSVNDGCDDSSVITGTGGMTACICFDSNTVASGEPEPSCIAGFGFSKSMWWKWTAPTTESYTFTTGGELTGTSVPIDTVMAVYTGGCDALAEVACDDDSGPGDTSQVVFAATSGTDYWIQVALFGDSDENGCFTLTWKRTAAATHWATEELRVDGVSVDTVSIGTSLTEIGGIIAGAAFCGSLNDHLIDYVKVGSTGFGTTDIFEAEFTSTITPPFDSTTGTGLSVVGGAMQVTDNPCVDDYAHKSFAGVVPGTYDDVYIQIRVKISSAEWASAGVTADFLDVLDATDDPTAPFTGIFVDIDTTTWFSDAIGPSGGTALEDTYQVIDLHFET